MTTQSSNLGKELKGMIKGSVLVPVTPATMKLARSGTP